MARSPAGAKESLAHWTVWVLTGWKPPAWRSSPPKGVTTPAGDSAAGLHPAGVPAASVDRRSGGVVGVNVGAKRSCVADQRDGHLHLVDPIRDGAGPRQGRGAARARSQRDGRAPHGDASNPSRKHQPTDFVVPIGCATLEAVSGMAQRKDQLEDS